MACATPAVEYAWKLQKYIQQPFANGVIPSNVLLVFHKYNLNVLTKADVDNIYAVIETKGDHAGAVCLLEKIHIYDSWFECLVTVLRDPDVKLGHLADKLEECKAILDSSLEQNRENPEEEFRKLREEIHKRDQKIMELEAGSNKHKQGKEEASQVTGTHNDKKKLTGKVYTELENLDNTIEQERMEHEIKLRQLKQEKENLDNQIEQERRQHEIKTRQLEQEKEQERKRFEEETKRREQESEQQRNQIKKLKEEREKLEQVIQQEREHQSKEITKLRAETRQKDQLITNLRNSVQSLQKTLNATTTRTLSTKKSDGVMLWNYYVTKRNRNIAEKYGLTQSNLPPHLQATGWISWRFVILREDHCEQVRVHGLIVAKDSIQARLRNILNNVNMGRRENEDDVIIKYELQGDTEDFFSSCYSCILALDKHAVNSVKECLMYIRDSITENLDQLVEEFGGWNDLMSWNTFLKYQKNDVMSETTCIRYLQAW